jgi:hypothetical protein
LDLNWEHKPTSRTRKSIQVKQSRLASQSKGITGRLEMWSAGRSPRLRNQEREELLLATEVCRRLGSKAQRQGRLYRAHAASPRPFGPIRAGHVSTRPRWRHPIRSSHVGPDDTGLCNAVTLVKSIFRCGHTRLDGGLG